MWRRVTADPQPSANEEGQALGSSTFTGAETGRYRAFRGNIFGCRLLRNWPPALPEWSTRNVRDAFFASPQFPRLLFPDAIKDTIARGVSNGQIAYAGKHGDGHFEPFVFEQALNADDVEISEDVFILTREAAVNYREAVKAAASGDVPPATVTPNSASTPVTGAAPTPTPASPTAAPTPTPSDDEVNPGGQTDFFKRMTWTGEVPPKLWMNFYTKVLSKHATDSGLKLKVTIETSPTVKGGSATWRSRRTDDLPANRLCARRRLPLMWRRMRGIRGGRRVRIVEVVGRGHVRSVAAAQCASTRGIRCRHPSKAGALRLARGLSKMLP
jgi:hypothetical protein